MALDVIFSAVMKHKGLLFFVIIPLKIFNAQSLFVSTEMIQAILCDSMPHSSDFYQVCYAILYAVELRSKLKKVSWFAL